MVDVREYTRTIHDYFDYERSTLKTGNSEDIRHEIQRQTRRWKSLLEMVQNTFKSMSRPFPVSEGLDQLISDAFIYKDTDPSQSPARLPFIVNDPDANYVRRNLYSVTAAMFVEAIEGYNNDTLALVAVEDYEFSNAIRQYVDTRRVIRQSDRKILDLTEQLIAAEERASAAAEAAEKGETERTEAELAREEEWERLKSAATEKFKLDASLTFWTEKSRSHNRTAICLASLFLIIVCGLVYLSYENISFIRENSPFVYESRPVGSTVAGDDSQVVVTEKGIEFRPQGLILFGGAAVFIIWILRAISQMFVQNLGLAEDAHLRSTLMKTYIALVATEGEKATAEARVVMLNALFRALPGYEEADLAPPNIADIMKQVQGTKKA